MASDRPWIAFIRGINVGGNKIIPMKLLAEKCTALGLRNVRTYIASGNILFEAGGTKGEAHARRIEKGILDAFGHEVTVMVRSRAELEALVATTPFGAAHRDADAKLYVAFLSAEPTLKPAFPQRFPKEGMELLGAGERMAFYVARPLKDKHVVPALPLEKIFGVPAATVRNWNTICKMLE
jgi:uncharacterized protein (DUF1697 family)